jgi:hypothetical protein
VIRPVAYGVAVIDVLPALSSSATEVVVRAPGVGEGFWAGGPSAVRDTDGVFWLAYRLRRPVDQGRGYANVVARSEDGVAFTPAATVTSAQLGCASLERPALVLRPDGGWRLYVSCSTVDSKHWWVEAVDADTVDGLAAGVRTVVLPGDEREAWKDVVVSVDGTRWRMWACRHPLSGGDDQADRMTSWYAESDDGVTWTMRAEALTPEPGTWTARGTRIAAVLQESGRWWALFDGRRSAAENWRERSGLAVGDGPDAFSILDGPEPAQVGKALRYASVICVDGGLRAYVEAAAPDGSHDLRTVYVPRPSAVIHSE